MKKVVLNYLVIAALAVAAACTSCGGGSGSGSGGGKSSGKIKMTTEAGGQIIVFLAGSGVATVDWGDGSEKVTLTLNENIYNPMQGFGVMFEHTYPNASIRTITINGNHITGLGCGLNRDLVTSLDVSRCTELTVLVCNYGSFASFDVSKNTALTYLHCVTQFTSLDVSKNMALSYLGCYGQLSAVALNTLFGTLHSNPGEKIIDIRYNPGADDCDRSIAERKGWTVR